VKINEPVVPSIPMRPGRAQKYDYEYRRNGTCNIFVAVEPKAGNHYIQVTDQRKREDFAWFIKDVVDSKYKNAKKVFIVLDNLNTHFKKSFEETFDCKREITMSCFGK
jgi:hypothetical protein